MTGPVPALPAALDTTDFDPDGDDHWRLQHGHLYRSRLIEDQSDSPGAALFKYEGRANGIAPLPDTLTYFSQGTARAVRYFALPPAQLEQAFHFHKPGEHSAPAPVNPLMPLRGPERAAEGPQGQTGAPAQSPPQHEPVDASGVTLSRTR